MIRVLCLHGAGTSSDILRVQLGESYRYGTWSVHALISLASAQLLHVANDSAAFDFHFLQGELECEPGPGVDGVFDGPYYCYYPWPKIAGSSDDDAVENVYALIYETVEQEGPFDVLLGFSHGGTLAYGFLAQHEKNHPFDPLFRCAAFFNALPPFHLDSEGVVVYDKSQARTLSMPSLHVIGKKDFVRQHSVALSQMAAGDSGTRMVIEHGLGHEMTRDRETNVRICRELLSLCSVRTP